MAVFAAQYFQFSFTGSKQPLNKDKQNKNAVCFLQPGLSVRFCRFFSASEKFIYPIRFLLRLFASMNLLPRLRKRSLAIVLAALLLESASASALASASSNSGKCHDGLPTDKNIYNTNKNINNNINKNNPNNHRNLNNRNGNGNGNNRNPFTSGCIFTMIERDRASGKEDRYPPDSNSPAIPFLRYVLNVHLRVCNSDDGVEVGTRFGRVNGAGGSNTNSHDDDGHGHDHHHEHEHEPEHEQEHENKLNSNTHHNHVQSIHGGFCEQSGLNYEEIRIAPGNWESALVLSWIYQILLSEVFQVPTTIEGGDGQRGDPKNSFYDPMNRFILTNQVYPVESLLEADRLDGKCTPPPSKSSSSSTSSSTTSSTTTSHKPCAHILPEVWDGAQNQDVIRGQMAGKVLPEESNGVVGNIGYFIPMHTAKKDPSLLSYLGLKGGDGDDDDDANGNGNGNNGNGKNNDDTSGRFKMASTFKTPLTWREYCDEISSNNCTTVDDSDKDGGHAGDGIASAYPNTTEHQNSYFVEGGLYNGYFHITDANNCTKYPNECRGHIAVPHCSWTIFTENQLHWNNISLASNGPIKPNNGYSYDHMVQIWNAANATKSDVLFWWWTPEILLEKFTGTPYEFQRVTFPTVTEECLQYRSQELSGSRCSDDSFKRIGQPLGSCDYAAVPMKKVLSAGLRTSAYAVPEARRSPAFDFLKQVYMPQYSLTNILRQLKLDSASSSNNNARETVCEWVYENLETLLRYAPPGYPKDISVREYITLKYSGYVVGGISLFCTIVTAFFTYKWREHHILKLSQINVLCCILFGNSFLAIAAFFGASDPSDFSCTATQWMIRIGYTLQFVPILIKISAINKITRMGRQLRRAQINQHRFKRIVIVAITAIVTYLIVWTLLDQPKRHEVVTENSRAMDAVDVHIGCASESVVWEIVAYSWECLILLATTVLTFQSHDVMKDLNESHYMAFMIYSQFLFLLARLASYGLMSYDVITSAMMSKLMALLISFDTIFAMSIYFWPKFFDIVRNKDDSRRMISLRTPGSSSHRRSYISGITLPNGKVPNLIRPRDSMRSEGDGISSKYRRISGITIPDGGIPNLIRRNSGMNSSLIRRNSAKGNAPEEIDIGEDTSNSVQKISTNYSSIYMGDSSDEEGADATAPVPAQEQRGRSANDMHTGARIQQQNDQSTTNEETNPEMRKSRVSFKDEAMDAAKNINSDDDGKDDDDNDASKDKETTALI